MTALLAFCFVFACCCMLLYIILWKILLRSCFVFPVTLLQLYGKRKFSLSYILFTLRRSSPTVRAYSILLSCFLYSTRFKEFKKQKIDKDPTTIALDRREKDTDFRSHLFAFQYAYVHTVFCLSGRVSSTTSTVRI